MSALRPFRILVHGRFAGSAMDRTDAERFAQRLSAGAVIIDERSGERFSRRDGQWLPSGRDLKIRAKRELAPRNESPRMWWLDDD